ncbi:(Fe-S)-binding protein [Blastococcus sp. TML/M2B]|uniref:(Fe-S)-binding protein n=1 Tax=Blastococcus sp. TML/M2B TaxID=2798727 RepID=UPI002814DB8A|nr:(Fe-S)-binding protein [Blastococcus sp. TML/M2B]
MPGTRKIVATCPHCFNSLGKEYPQVGGEYEVIHHTQLLGQLIEEGRLVPVTPIDRKVTYHDPCFLGRHNKVYTPPREILESVQGLSTQEMHRCKDRGFCCGAGGARMWMEEKIGKRINMERTEEALELDPDVISTACPFCITMLSDALTSKKQNGEAGEHVRGPRRQPDPAALDAAGCRGRPGRGVRSRRRHRGRRRRRPGLRRDGARPEVAAPARRRRRASPAEGGARRRRSGTRPTPGGRRGRGRRTIPR